MRGAKGRLLQGETLGPAPVVCVYQSSISVHRHIKLETYLTELQRRVTLTLDLPQVESIVPSPCSVKSVRPFSKYHVHKIGNERTDGRTDMSRTMKIGTGSHFDKGNRCCRNVNNKIKKGLI